MEPLNINKKDNLDNLIWDFHVREHLSKNTLLIAFHHPVDPDFSDKDLHEKYVSLKADADLGLSYAQYEVGECYRLGKGIGSSLKKAIHYYELAIEQNNIDAMMALGKLYSKGIGIEQSHEKAFALFSFAAGKGDCLGQFLVASCYEEGKGTRSSIEKAIHYYQLSANNGHHAAYRRLALIYLDGISGVAPSQELANQYFNQFLTFHRSRADQGDTDSMVWLGNCYCWGEGVETNPEIAFTYYKKAADKNDGWGLLKLAQCYEKGEGITQSTEKAMCYFKLAYKYGEEDAIYYLAYILEGLEQYEESFNYWNTISKCNFSKEEKAEADYHLGVFFENGYGVKQSNKNARYYYRRSSESGCRLSEERIGHTYSEQELHDKFVQLKADADLGLSDALFQVGKCYHLGQGTSASIKQAIQYYTLAARQQHPDALIALGKLYEEGIGLEQSCQKAFCLFNLAADQNDCLGQFLVGSCYQKGIGVPITMDCAIHYYKLAAKNGHQTAYRHLALIYLNGIGVTPSQKLASRYFNQYLTFHRSLANKGHTSSMVRLGNCYRWGEGVEINPEIAFNYYKKAADKNDSWGFLNLASCFENGDGVAKSIEMSIHYFNLAYKHGEEGAIYRLAILFENLKQYAESFNYWKEISQGNFSKLEKSEADYHLGLFFENGYGVEQSNESTLFYYKRSARNGFKMAYQQIGRAYLFGLFGLEQSYTKSRVCFNLFDEKFSSSKLCRIVTEYKVDLQTENIDCIKKINYPALIGRVSRGPITFEKSPKLVTMIFHNVLTKIA